MVGVQRFKFQAFQGLTRPCQTRAARVYALPPTCQHTTPPTLRDFDHSFPHHTFFSWHPPPYFFFLPCRFISPLPARWKQVKPGHWGRLEAAEESSVVFQPFSEQSSNLLYPFSIACNIERIYFSDRSSCAFRPSALPHRSPSPRTLSLS